MSELSQTKASNVFQCQGSLEKLLVNFTIFPSKIHYSLTIKKDRNICFYTETRVKIVGYMSSDAQCMRILQITCCLDWP